MVEAFFFGVFELLAAAFVNTFCCHDAVEIRVSSKFEKVFQLMIRLDDADHLGSRDPMAKVPTSWCSHTDYTICDVHRQASRCDSHDVWR